MPRHARARSIRSTGTGNEERVLTVAQRLFAQRGYRSVTVREIAQAAQVTHPLIYHYFGSKRGLLAAVVERTQSAMREAFTGDEPADAVAALARDSLTGRRRYYLTLVRALADGMSPADWPGGYPTVEKLLEVLALDRPRAEGRPSETEMREMLAVGVAAVLGWVLIEEAVLEVVGLSAEQRDAARERVVRAFTEILRPALPPGDS